MPKQIDFTKLRTSWTKYDIVRVIEIVRSITTVEKFKRKEAPIDEPILRSFLGIKSLDDSIPSYWYQIQEFPKEKSLFALFAAMFTHGEVVQDFATHYSSGEDMKGVFTVEPGIKQYTNIRSALVESGAAEPTYRRTLQVPYDFSLIFQNATVGRLFKQVLQERISRLTDKEITDDEFFEICYANNFHKALSVSKERFAFWLNGTRGPFLSARGTFIEKVEIANFFSVEEATLTFEHSKEIYFLGENGDGKSLILMGTYLAFNGNFIETQTDLEATGKVADILRSQNTARLIGIDNKGFEYRSADAYQDNLFAYGTHRGRVSTDYPEQYGFMSLFDSEQQLTNPVTWLKDQKLIELQKALDANNAIAEEKTLPRSYSVNLLETLFHELLEKNVEVTIEGTTVLFREKGTNLLFEQLSEGYKSVLIFVCDLLVRLNTIADMEVSPMLTEAVVMVDEIDLHLHPKWQRRIIKKLRSIFPNIQFIFTTHSPTIIQGASDDAIIFRVYRNKSDGKTRVSQAYYRKDLNHLMINTILTSPLFGMDDSRMSDKVDPDTNETYLLYRINEKLKEELENQKKEGKNFVGDTELDTLIQKIIKEELGKND